MADLSMEDGAPSGQFADPATSAVPNASLLDLAVLVSHIRRVVPANLESDGVLLDSLKELLQADATLELLRRFISDPQCKAITIKRQLVKGKVILFCFVWCYHFLNAQISFSTDDDEEDQAGQLNSADMDNCVHYSISEDVKYSSPKNSILVLNKCGPILEAEKPMRQQIRLLTLEESTPYEDLHRCVSDTMAPFFKSLVKETGRAER